MTLDPHNLIASGVELLNESELAKALGISRAALAPLLAGALYRVIPHARVDGRRRYRLDDVRTAVAPYLPTIRERARLAAERERTERAAAAVRRAEKDRAHAAHVARKQGRAPTRRAMGSGAPPHPTPRPERDRPVRGNVDGPEVFVRRARSVG
jgi:TPP-dependent pyruvate/acetoin dehydrogenase alpha subunit